MALFHQQPTPKEILVERVGPLRWAERDGSFDRLVPMLAERATRAAAAVGS